jgi:hypothetical protein
MIEINLLPEELRKKKAFKMPKVSIGSAPIVIGIAALLISAHATVIVLTKLNDIAHRKMEKRWMEVAPAKLEVEKVRAENLRVRKKVDTVEDLISRKVVWSRKLNQLSDLIIPGVWYTRLSIKKKSVPIESDGPKETLPGKKMLGKGPAQKRMEIPYLKIEGEVSSAYGEEIAIIGKFIEQLKADEDFFGDFSGIELDSTELHSILDIDVMKFNIECYFNEAFARVVE